MSTFSPPSRASRRTPVRSLETRVERRWRWWLLAILSGLTALAVAVTVVCLCAMQLTERDAAETLLGRVVRSLLETDRFVATSWDTLVVEAESGEPIPLEGWPLDLALSPEALNAGQASVAAAITQATVQTLYEHGFDVLQDEPQAIRFFSEASAFSSTTGRLTEGGNTVATVALGVSLALFVSLALATAAQARGMARLAVPGLAIAVGAGALLLAAEIAGAMFTDRAGATQDPFVADMWLIAVDVAALVSRNATLAALFGGVISFVALLGFFALLWIEQRRRI